MEDGSSFGEDTDLVDRSSKNSAGFPYHGLPSGLPRSAYEVLLLLAGTNNPSPMILKLHGVDFPNRLLSSSSAPYQMTDGTSIRLTRLRASKVASELADAHDILQRCPTQDESQALRDAAMKYFRATNYWPTMGGLIALRWFWKGREQFRFPFYNPSKRSGVAPSLSKFWFVKGPRAAILWNVSRFSAYFGSGYFIGNFIRNNQYGTFFHGYASRDPRLADWKQKKRDRAAEQLRARREDRVPKPEPIIIQLDRSAWQVTLKQPEEVQGMGEPQETSSFPDESARSQSVLRPDLPEREPMLRKWKEHQDSIRGSSEGERYSGGQDNGSPTVSDVTTDGFQQDSKSSSPSKEENRMLTDDDMRRQERKPSTDADLRPLYSDLALRRHRRNPQQGTPAPQPVPADEPRSDQDSHDFLSDLSSDSESTTSRASPWARLRKTAMLSTDPSQKPSTDQRTAPQSSSEDAENIRLATSDLRRDEAQRSRDSRSEAGESGSSWSRLRENENGKETSWARIRAQAGDGPGGDQGQSGSRVEDDRERREGARAKIEAQRQFDEMLERERQGGDNAGEAGGVEAKGSGGGRWR